MSLKPASRLPSPLLDVADVLRLTVVELRRHWRRLAVLVVIWGFVIASVHLWSAHAFVAIYATRPINLRPLGMSMESLATLAVIPPLLIAWAGAFGTILPVGAKAVLEKPIAQPFSFLGMFAVPLRQLKIGCAVAMLLFAPLVVLLSTSVLETLLPIDKIPILDARAMPSDFRWIVSLVWFVATLPFVAVVVPASIAEPTIDAFNRSILFGRANLINIVVVVAIAAGPFFVSGLVYRSYGWNNAAQLLVMVFGFSGQLPATMFLVILQLCAIVAAVVAVSVLYRTATQGVAAPEDLYNVFD